MKKSFVIFFLWIVWTTPCLGRDFIVEFIEENYRETQAPFSYDPLIYHSIQVKSGVGPKLLILTGKDYTYRKWLRTYIARDKQFIARVSDENADEFIRSKAYEMEVTSLHPFNENKWTMPDPEPLSVNYLEGNNIILIVDPNEKRTGLIETVVKKMGYQTKIFKTGDEALALFKVQPEKFIMVIANHTLDGMPWHTFVEQVLKIDHQIPIVIDTGYKNKYGSDKSISKFSSVESVHLKPVILRELSKTIGRLVKKNA